MIVELGKGDNVPLWWVWHLVVRRCAIHSGRDEEVREHRSPSFSRSLNRRFVMDDGHQLLGSRSLTSILAEGERWLYGSCSLEGALRFKKARR